jgi:hypothetical protein
VSNYHDASWGPPKGSSESKTLAAMVPLGREIPSTFRESFRTLPEPYRTTFLRVGAAMLDLDDPAVFEKACRLADSVPDVP